MKTWVKVKIEVNDTLPRYCGKECTFLEDFYDHCMLFKEDLCGDMDKDLYYRCKECLDLEIKE